MTVGGKDRFRNMGNIGAEEVSRLIDICLEAGLNFIDTADLYSFGAAEEALGEALEGRRHQMLIGTKVFMRMGPGVHDVGLSRKHMMDACEASLRRLRTDYVDLYMAHDPDSLVPAEETMRAFDDLIRQGKVRYAGCSNFSGWQLMKSLAVSDSRGLARYISQEVHYSLLCRDIEHELVPLGLDQGVGVMAWSPLHYGLLTGKFRRDARPSETRLNQLEAPGVIDQERLYRIVDVLLEIGRAARGVGRAGGAQLGHEQARGEHGDHRRAQRAATPRQPRRGAVAAHRRRDGAARRGERHAGTLPLLAPAQIRRGAESAAAEYASRPAPLAKAVEIK